MNESQYMKKIADIIVETSNRNQKSFKPSKISKKYNDIFEIKEFETINNALTQMEKEEFITLKFASKVSPEVIKILINDNKVSELANRYSLTLKSDINEEISNILSSYKNSPYMEIANFVNKELLSLLNNKTVKFTQGQNIAPLKEVLIGANAILSQEYAISLRELSIIVYNDSKILENRLSQILSIINTDNIDKNDFLAQHNVFRNDVYTCIKGNVVLYFNNGDRISLTSENNGSIQLSKEVVDNIDRIIATKMLSLENLTSFNNLRTTKEDGIVLYLGGFSNDANIEFIKKTTCPLYHFGDIDANGFKILNDLRKRTGLPIYSYKMDIETIAKYSEFGKGMSEYNRKTLKQMLLSDEYSVDEKECFQELLNRNKIIEQEIIK